MATIKDIRLGKGLSQAELAQLTYLTVTTISRIENGKPVAKNTLKRVCDALGVSLDTVDAPIRPIPASRNRRKS